MIARLLCTTFLIGVIALPAHAQTAFDDPMVASATSGGALVAVEPSVAVGNIALGSTAQAIVRFRNDGGQPITFGEINIYPSSNVSVSIGLNQCAENPLQFGGECAIVLAVKALKAGDFQSQMLIQHSGRSKLITATVTGTVATGDQAAGDQAINEIQANPASLDFGSIEASRPSLRTIQLRNTTSDPIKINNIAFDSPQKDGFDIRSECEELAAGQSCLLSVTWSPLLPGPTSGFIVVDHSGTSQITNIPVQGEYKPTEVTDVSKYPSPVPGKGLLVASLDNIAFGDTVDTQSAVTVTVVNSGDTDLTLNSMSLSVPTPGLSLDPQGCKMGTKLKPNEACALTLRWAPQSVGVLKTDLRIGHDGVRGLFVLPVTGRATAVVPNTNFAGDGLLSADEFVDEGGSGMSVDGISTDLPGSAGLSLSDINDLNSALANDIAGVIERSTGGEIKSPATRRQNAQVNAASNTLSGYIITSHSINRAVLMGQDTSIVVTHNKPIMIAGVKWTPTITPDGVDMVSGGKTVSLLFDSSLAANKSILTENYAIMPVMGVQQQQGMNGQQQQGMNGQTQQQFNSSSTPSMQ